MVMNFQRFLKKLTGNIFVLFTKKKHKAPQEST